MLEAYEDQKLSNNLLDIPASAVGIEHGQSKDMIGVDDVQSSDSCSELLVVLVLAVDHIQLRSQIPARVRYDRIREIAGNVLTIVFNIINL